MKESAKRDAARALEGFERRAERIEEGKPARSQFQRPQSVQKGDEVTRKEAQPQREAYLQGANFKTEVAVTKAWPPSLSGMRFLVVPFDDGSRIAPARGQYRGDSWDCWRRVAARVGQYLEREGLVCFSGEGLPDLVVFVGYDSSNDQFSDSAQFGIMPDLRRICSLDSEARIENARQDIRASAIIAVAAMNWQNKSGQLLWRTKGWGNWFGEYDRWDELVQALALIDAMFEGFPHVDPRIVENRKIERQWQITDSYHTGSINKEWYSDISYDVAVQRVRAELASSGLYHENPEQVMVHLTRAAPKPPEPVVPSPMVSRQNTASVTTPNTHSMDFSKNIPKPDTDTVIMERVDAWNGMTDEVIYNKAYNHNDRAAVGMVVEGLREQAIADNPKIGGPVWWIVFLAVLLGGAALALEVWGLLLLGLVCWGAQSWICAIAKRGKAPVPPHLVAYLMANAQELKRALDRGDARGVALHAQIEHDTQREIYHYMRGTKK